MGGWKTTGDQGWHLRRERASGLPQTGGRWTAPDFGIAIVAFLIHWELCAAFLALKLWHQASGSPGSVFTFARDKWEGLVAATRSVFAGSTSLASSLNFGNFGNLGVRSSGSHAFDTWRGAELERIDAERSKLRAAERDFAAYRDELLHATDREDFERFMQARTASNATPTA